MARSYYFQINFSLRSRKKKKQKQNEDKMIKKINGYINDI